MQFDARLSIFCALVTSYWSFMLISAGWANENEKSPYYIKNGKKIKENCTVRFLLEALSCAYRNLVKTICQLIIILIVFHFRLKE